MKIFMAAHAGMEETMETNVISDVFGTKVFNDEVMQEYLPKKTYQSLKKTIESGEELTPEVANVVAHGMKEWALKKWCYPLYSLVPANDRRDRRKTGLFPWSRFRVTCCFGI